MPRNDLHDALSTAVQNLNDTNTTTRRVLNDLACSLVDLREHTDDDLHRYVSSIESFARQIMMHGDPDLDGHTVNSLLTTARTHVTDYRNGDVPVSVLTDHETETREDILNARPDTSVIEDYGLEAAFDETVERMLQDMRSQP